MGQLKEDLFPQETWVRWGGLLRESQGLGWGTDSGMAVAVEEQWVVVVEVECATHPHLP